MVTELTEDIKGKDVLLVEDIVDSGLTAQYLVKTLAKKKPRSIKVCTLLSKPDRRTINVAIDYVGFKIPISMWSGMGSITSRSTGTFPIWLSWIWREIKSKALVVRLSV